MRVQLISKDNGWGLSKDVSILKQAILKAQPDAVVDFTDWQRTKKDSRFDINIFLELLSDRFFAQAPRNILVPNPEWFMIDWTPLLGRGVTEVWAKTHDARRIYSHHHKSVHHTGWTSEDQFMLDVERKKTMVHLAGNSSAKGTEAVVAAMRMVPEHRLTLVSNKKLDGLPSNIDQRSSLSPEVFRRLQNEALIHLCPSSYEGFGHYINEARSVGAVIITTNAEPMSELVSSSFGFGAAVQSVSNQGLAQHKHASAESIAALIRMAMGCTPEVLRLIGLKARSAYLSDRATFETNISKALT